MKVPHCAPNVDDKGVVYPAHTPSPPIPRTTHQSNQPNYDSLVPTHCPSIQYSLHWFDIPEIPFITRMAKKAPPLTASHVMYSVLVTLTDGIPLTYLVSQSILQKWTIII